MCVMTPYYFIDMHYGSRNIAPRLCTTVRRQPIRAALGWGWLNGVKLARMLFMGAAPAHVAHNVFPTVSVAWNVRAVYAHSERTHLMIHNSFIIITTHRKHVIAPPHTHPPNPDHHSALNVPSHNHRA